MELKLYLFQAISDVIEISYCEIHILSIQELIMYDVNVNMRKNYFFYFPQNFLFNFSVYIPK